MIKKYYKDFCYILILFILLFCYDSSIVDEFSVFSGLRIPYIDMKYSNLLIVFIVIILFSLIGIKKLGKLKYDILLLFFFARVISMIIQLLKFQSFNLAVGNYYTYIFDLFFYFAILNYDYYEKSRMIKYLKIFGIILAFQVVFNFITSPVSYNNSLYKYYMNLPYGASNSISASLVIILMLFMEDRKKTIVKILLCASIILCKSRLSIIIMILLFIIYIYSHHKDKKIVTFFVITILLSIIYIIFSANVQESIKSVLSGYYGNVEGNFIDKITSGRLTLFFDDLVMSMQHLFFGAGPAYLNKSIPHNFIIQLLFENGIIITLLFLIAINKKLRIIKSNKKNYFNYMILILLLSSFEVVLFRLGKDIIIFTALIYFCENQYKKGVSIYERE